MRLGVPLLDEYLAFVAVQLGDKPRPEPGAGPVPCGRQPRRPDAETRLGTFQLLRLVRMRYPGLSSPPERENNAAVDLDDKLKLDYEQALATYRQFADIRFKLLAFVPALSGAAIALLTRANIERWDKVGIAALGFLVTFGIVLYDQRNTQFYNGAITRAQFLEKQLRLKAFGGDKHPGLFGSRRDHSKRRLLGLPIGHDLGLAFVYCPVLGGWAFVAVSAGWPGQPSAAPIAGLAVATAFFAQFEWNDGKPKRLRTWWRSRPK
jgi:hypothetical protein